MTSNELTEEQILGLQGRELDRAIAERVLGWDGIYISRINGEMCCKVRGEVKAVAHYHKSLDAVRPVLVKAVEECGLDAYYQALWEVMEADMGIVSTQGTVLATAEQLARAALLAYARRRPVEDPASSEGVELT